MSTLSRKIFTTLLIVGATNGVVLGITVFRDLILAYRFGTGEIIDSFLMGLVVPTMVVQLIGVSMGLAIVPEFIRLRGHSDHGAPDSLSSSATLAGLILLVGVAAVLLLLHRPLTEALSMGFDPERKRLTGIFFAGFAPCIVLQGWSAILSGLLNATNRFLVAALAPMLRPLVICIIALTDMGGSAIALLSAYVVGAVAETAWITIAATRQNISWRPRWGGLTAAFSKVLREFLMVMIGTGVLSAAIMADQYLAGLAGPGGVAAYGYGSKMVSMLIGAGALPLGVAILPHFAVQIREKEWVRLCRFLLQWSVLVLVVSVPVSMLLWFYSFELVQMVFQRGAFSAEDSRVVAGIQECLAWQLPFYLCGILYVRVLISLQRNGLVALIAVLNAVTNVGGSVMLLGHLGVKGVALAASGGYLVAGLLSGAFSFVLLYNNLRRSHLVSVPVERPAV